MVGCQREYGRTALPGSRRWNPLAQSLRPVEATECPRAQRYSGRPAPKTEGQGQGGTGTGTGTSSFATAPQGPATGAATNYEWPEPINDWGQLPGRAATGLLLLQSQKGSLPPEVVTAIEGIALTSAGQEAKDLHRAVKQQARAKQELAKLGAQRLASSAAWASYLQEVTETVTKQMAAHDKHMASLDEAEAQWRSHLQTASTELAKLSDSRVTDEPDDDAAMETSKATDALAISRRAEQQTQQQQLLNSLREASQTAASLATAVKREGSRTPRRAKRPPDGDLTIDSSPEMKEDEDTAKAKLAMPLQELSTASSAPLFK